MNKFVINCYIFLYFQFVYFFYNSWTNDNNNNLAGFDLNSIGAFKTCRLFILMIF